MSPPRMDVTPHTAFGVSLALLGVVLTLDNLGFVNFGAVWRFWPIIPMLVGTAYVVQGREARDWLIGTAWLVAGTAFLLRNLDVFSFRLTDFWPLLLVALGLKLIQARRRHQQCARSAAAAPPVPPDAPTGFSVGDVFAPRFEEGTTDVPPVPPGAGAAASARFGQIVRVFAILWGADRRARGPVAHVEISAVMGGCDVDLRHAVPTRDPLMIQVFALWGGIDIQVPAGWSVHNEAWPILGGIVDNTQSPALPTHRVILRGMAFMGGVEIKN